MPPLPSPEALRQALEALPPREAQLLGRLVLEGLSLGACARLYGVSEEALAVHQLRAGRALAAALAGADGAPAARVEPWEDEVAAAWALVRALAAEGALAPAAASGAGAASRPVAELLHHLRACAGDVRAALEAAAAEEARSPARRREDLLRRAGVLLLVALTAYFLLRR